MKQVWLLEHFATVVQKKQKNRNNQHDFRKPNLPHGHGYLHATTAARALVFESWILTQGNQDKIAPAAWGGAVTVLLYEFSLIQIILQPHYRPINKKFLFRVEAKTLLCRLSRAVFNM